MKAFKIILVAGSIVLLGACAGTPEKPAEAVPPPTNVTLDEINIAIENGVKVIDRFELPKSVLDGGTTAADKEGGFLKLQDHGNPVEYRNIWVEPFFAASRK